MLSANQSVLAQTITKDTYNLSFITLPSKYDEKELEDALESTASSWYSFFTVLTRSIREIPFLHIPKIPD